MLGAITGGATSSNYFAAGMQVSTSAGNKAIEDIKPGDLVYSCNTDTGEIGLKLVVQTFVHKTNELVHVKLDVQTIDCTTEHPFYVPQKGWTAAKDLREAFDIAYDNIIKQGYINNWTWKKPVKSPTKEYVAEVYCEHKLNSFDISIIVKGNNNQEIKRVKLISEYPHELAYEIHLGELKWISSNEVSLVNKLKTNQWSVKL